MLARRSGYEVEFKKFTQFDPEWMGPRGEVNEETRHLAAAGAWGLFPSKDAAYINYAGPTDPEQCYTAIYETPQTDAFWSITVYGDDGFMKSENNVINDRNVTSNDDGTFTAYFGSEAACGAKSNRVDISTGWNFLLRIYRPFYKLLFPLPENLSRPSGITSGVGEIFGNISFLAGFNQMVSLFHIVGKTQLALIETVPPGVVRRHHHCAHAGPPALMMPQFVVLDL